MSLEATQVLGTIAALYGVGGALSVLLQARQMRARGSSDDVSARFLAVYVGGFAVWLLYGLSIGDVPIILVHAVGLLCGTITLAVTLRLRGSLLPSATTQPSAPFQEIGQPMNIAVVDTGGSLVSHDRMDDRDET